MYLNLYWPFNVPNTLFKSADKVIKQLDLTLNSVHLKLLLNENLKKHTNIHFYRKKKMSISI